MKLRNFSPLNMKVYQKIRRLFNVSKSIRCYDAVQNEKNGTQSSLIEMLDQVTTEKARQTLIYQKKVFLVAVPIEDVDIIKQLKSCIDNANVDDVIKEKSYY
jgi:hypothetical protein